LVAGGHLDTAKTGTACYKVVFEVVEGEHTGRKIFHDVWLTSKALRMSGHELAKLGFRSIKELDQRPLPTGLLADVEVVVNADDDGTERNRVRRFEVIEADVPAADFRPADPNGEKGEADAEHLDAASRLDAHGFNYETNRYESSTPLLDTANGRKKK
jgi:hypothetical protein